MSKKIVIKIKYGGLGDHLLYSPIPRLAKQKHGYDKVFISNFSDYKNIKTKRLVWEYNPFVDGFIDEDGPIPSFKTVENGKNLLDAVVDFVGLPDDGERFREPEIYYVPKNIETFNEKSIYDPNYMSSISHPSSQMIEKYFKDNNIKIDYQMKKLFHNSFINNIKELDSNGLENFCDIIFSCRKLYCLTSGAATLAAALRKPSVILYRDGILPMFHHSKLHTYIKI